MRLIGCWAWKGGGTTRHGLYTAGLDQLLALLSGKTTTAPTLMALIKRRAKMYIMYICGNFDFDAYM